MLSKVKACAWTTAWIAWIAQALVRGRLGKLLVLIFGIVIWI